MKNRSIGIVYLIGLLLCAVTSNAQQNPYLKVDADPLLDSLIQASIDANKTSPSIQGFRIQIYSNSDRKTATDTRTKALQLLPECEVYLVYQQPYFRVRVGDFRNRFEAFPIYRILLTEFDNVLIVPDKINLPKLNASLVTE
jgi:hypothetical protein